MARNAALSILTAEPGLTHYLEEIRRFPMLEREEEYGLAKRWREHGDRDAAHKLVTSHRGPVTRIARDYRGYGLPISEAISEGNVGLMQAVERFEPEKGFRFASYAVWRIKAAIQEYILRSWSLVKMGTTANQKKVFFNLRKAQNKISILDDGDMRPDQVKIIARRIGVTETDVIYMNRRLGADAPLNVAIRGDGDSGEWQDWLVDESPDQETTLAASEEFDNRRKTLCDALTVLNKRERRIFETRRLAEEQIALVELAEEFGVSRERVRRWRARRLCRCVSFQPSPVVGKLTMDVSLWVRFTATERRERGAAHRVLIEPSLDDPCTALCIIDRAPKPRTADGKLSEVS